MAQAHLRINLLDGDPAAIAATIVDGLESVDGVTSVDQLNTPALGMSGREFVISFLLGVSGSLTASAIEDLVRTRLQRDHGDEQQSVEATILDPADALPDQHSANPPE